MSRLRLATLLGALVLAGRPAPAQESTLVLSQTQVIQASQQGFRFGMQELQFGSRCFGSEGQNTGRGLLLRLTSEGLNGYARSICRHTGFEGKQLQNGWRVSAVSRTTTCQYNDFGTWRTLDGSNCVFNVLTSPAVNGTSLAFKVDATLNGSALQDRRATLTWSISIRGPTGTSPWTAQRPGVPALASPANDVQLPGVGNFTWSRPAGAAVDHFRLCISRESFTGGCEERARVTGTSASNVALPFRGERVKWFVQACNAAGCTGSASSLLIRNTLAAATLVSPAAGATATTRRPTFQWQSVPGVQTYTLYVYHPNPLQEFSLPNLSSSATSFTPATDLTMDTPAYWMVRACTAAAGCGMAVNSQQVRQLNLPRRVTFATLSPTFQHARCRNCHATAATNFTAGSVPGLPAGHQSVSATTNCQTCHTDALLPATGTINPHWHAAPVAMDFRNRTDQQICEDIKTRLPGTQLASHLKEDKLVLWAVGDGRRPSNSTPLALAPPGSISAWRTLVDTWVNAGMACN